MPDGSRDVAVAVVSTASLGFAPGRTATMTSSETRTVILSPVRSSSNSFTSGGTSIVCVVLELVRSMRVRVDRSIRSTVPDRLTSSRTEVAGAGDWLHNTASSGITTMCIIDI